MVKISASLLSSKHNIKEMTNVLDKLNIDYFHIDVMDNIFVNNTGLTYNDACIIKENTNKPLDIHLMVEDIEKYVDIYKELKPEYITIHYEAIKDLSIIDKIHEYGIKCGISIKPDTKEDELYSLLNKIDLVLIMSVNPGWGGQEFIPSSLDKIKKIKEKINSNVLISVDGGINNNSADKCIKNGADILVIGSALTNYTNRLELINTIKNVK